MPTILITGASRGLGLEFTRQYAEAGWRVHAACREPGSAEALAALASGSVTLHRLDVTDGAEVAALARALGAEALDVLLNNAGVYGGKGDAFGETDYEAWAGTMDANVFGPTRMIEAFIGHVARGGRKQIVSISSRMGSIGGNDEGGACIYRSSKAALNAVIKSLSVDLAGRGVTLVAFHPGWVATDMGGPDATLQPGDSVSAMRKVIDGLTPADNGRFLNYDGKPIEW